MSNLNAVAESSIVVRESSIVAKNSIVVDVAEIKLLKETFSDKLDEDYDQREKSSASSFKLYLDMALHVLNQNTLTLRNLILFIEEKNNNKTEEKIAKSGLKGAELSKLRRSLNISSTDFIRSMGNKILDFLRDVKHNRAVQNLDYLGLLSSIESKDDKVTLGYLIDSLKENQRFSDMIIPERLADERLYLSVKAAREGLLKISNAVIETIRSKAKDPDIIDLTSNDFPVGVNVTDPQFTKIQKMFESYKTEIGSVVSRKRKRISPQVDSTTVCIRSSIRATDKRVTDHSRRPHRIVNTRRRRKSKKTQVVLSADQEEKVREEDGSVEEDGSADQEASECVFSDDEEGKGDTEDKEDDGAVSGEDEENPEDVVVVKNLADEKESGPVSSDDEEEKGDTEDKEDDGAVSCEDEENPKDVVVVKLSADQEGSVVVSVPIRRNPYVVHSDDEDQEDVVDEKDNVQAGVAVPNKSDDDEKVNDKDIETSTPASHLNVGGKYHEDVNPRKRNRQTSTDFLGHFDDFLYNLEMCPLSCDAIIEIGRKTFLALEKKYSNIPGADVKEFESSLQLSVFTRSGPAESATSSVNASQPVSSSVEPVAATIATSSSAAKSTQGGPAESATSSANASQPVSSSVEPVAATIATSSSAAQSNQGGPAESATSSANASQPVSSSVIPAVKTIVASSSAASSKKGHASKPLSVNASQQISSSVTSASAPQSKQRNLNSAISSVAAGFAKLASSTTTSKSSSVNASKPVSSSVTSASAPQSK